MLPILDRLVEHLSRQRDARWAREFSDQLASAFYDSGLKARAAFFKYPLIHLPWDAVVELYETHPLLTLPILHVFANRGHNRIQVRLERPISAPDVLPGTWQLVIDRNFAREVSPSEVAHWVAAALDALAGEFETALRDELALNDLELSGGDVDAIDDPHPDGPDFLLSGYCALISISNPGWIMAMRHLDFSEDFFLIVTQTYAQLTGTDEAGKKYRVKGPVAAKVDPKELATWIRGAIGSLTDRPGDSSTRDG
jgi:hypothetical protein